VPQKVQAGPGTAVVAPGVRKVHLELDAIPQGTYDICTNRELNGGLFSDEFFDAENYPWMKFSSTRVIRTGPRSFNVTGDSTMRNVTRSIMLDVTFHGAGNDPFSGKDIIVGFDAKGMVKRSEFGLGKYVPIVSDETTIAISAEFKKRAIDNS